MQSRIANFTSSVFRDIDRPLYVSRSFLRKQPASSGHPQGARTGFPAPSAIRGKKRIIGRFCFSEWEMKGKGEQYLGLAKWHGTQAVRVLAYTDSAKLHSRPTTTLLLDRCTYAWLRTASLGLQPCQPIHNPLVYSSSPRGPAIFKPGITRLSCLVLAIHTLGHSTPSNRIVDRTNRCSSCSISRKLSRTLLICSRAARWACSGRRSITAW